MEEDLLYKLNSDLGFDLDLSLIRWGTRNVHAPRFSFDYFHHLSVSEQLHNSTINELSAEDG